MEGFVEGYVVARILFTDKGPFLKTGREGYHDHGKGHDPK